MTATESGVPASGSEVFTFGVPAEASDDPPEVKAERALVVDWAAEEIVLRSALTGMVVLVG